MTQASRNISLKFGCDLDDEDLPRFSVSHIHNATENAIEFIVHDSYERVADILSNEPEFVEERPADCVCSDQAFSVYGCMCRIRKMP